MQLVIFILQVSPAPSPCCFNFVVSLATVGWFEKIPQDGNRTNVHTQAWCVGMFGARFAVFVRRARVLPNP